MAGRGSSLRDRQIGKFFRVDGDCALFKPRILTFPHLLVSLKKILNLNHDVDSNDSDDAHANGLMSPSAAILNEDGEPIWKVLVLDDLGRDVISSVMRVNDLRSMGVTMHM